MLFIALLYIYVVIGIYLAAVAYVLDNKATTIGAQYFKMLIVLSLWPLFMPTLWKEALKIAKTAPILSFKGETHPPRGNNEHWEDLARFLDRKYLFEIKYLSKTATSRTRAMDTDTRLRLWRHSHATRENPPSTQQTPEEVHALTPKTPALTR